MNDKAKLLHDVWDNSASIITKKEVPLSRQQFDELIASLFCPGPFYYYIVDFYDRQIKYMHPNVKPVLGLDPETATFNDIIGCLHPDDMEFVAKAEQTVLNLIYGDLGRNHVTDYKMGYCFRFKTADGSYQLFQHQAVILTTDERGGFSKSLNIHTNINHLTTINTHKASMINLKGGTSYLNIDVYNPSLTSPTTEYPFTSREREIIKLMAEGFATPDISKKLAISEHTVRTHRRNILSKTDSPNTASLIGKCIQNGLI